MSNLNVGQDADADSVSIPSSWQSNRSCQESDVQTSEITFVESGTQSKSSSSTGVQTDNSQENGSEAVDMTKLAEWLTRITPRVLQELEKNRKSHVFDEYKLQETTDCSVKHLYTLSVEENHPQFNFITSAISWSSTGGVLAVARCASEHRSWCDHSGCVFLHQTNKLDLKSNAPYRLLDVSSCVTALSAHPTESFILACGTVSGEVTVWNLQRDDAVIIGSMTLHSEAVVQMDWIQNFDVKNMRPALATASKDGSVIIWTMQSISSSLKASQCFLLQSEKENVDLGIVCAKFNPSNPSLFLAGIEGGNIAVCSTDSRRPCHRKRTSVSKDLDCCDPVLNILDGHKGAITGVEWVPGSRDLFVSCGTDSELHVYSHNDMSLLRTIYLVEPACGFEMISGHPNIAATWGSSGDVHLHDIHTSKVLPPLDLQDEEKKFPLSLVHTRSASSLQLALGRTDGKISVWQISHQKFLKP